eukprot:1152339-Pelagomonas_calceolata.AAC.3
MLVRLTALNGRVFSCAGRQDDKGKFAVKKTVEALEELHARGPPCYPVVAKGINIAAKAFLPQFNKAMFAAGNNFGARCVRCRLFCCCICALPAAAAAAAAM